MKRRRYIISEIGRRAEVLLPICLFILSLLSCGPDSFLDRRNTIIDNGQTARVRLYVDWTKTGNSKPSGMTVMMFSPDGSNNENATNNVDSIDLSLPLSTYRLLVFNLSPAEFGSMTFNNTDSYSNINVTLNDLQSRQNEEWDSGVTYQREPEAFAMETDTINVTKQMVEACSDDSTMTYVYNETPASIVSTLNIKVHVRGIANIRTVEGSISGMAGGYMLTQHHPSTSTATHLLDEWRSTTDADSTANGVITASISTFGLPYDGISDIGSRDSTANVLTLFFSLRDGKTTQTIKYNVGNRFQYVSAESNDRSQAESNSNSSKANIATRAASIRTLYLDLTINDGPTLPDVQDDNNSSGFNADVDPWEDGGNTDVDF